MPLPLLAGYLGLAGAWLIVSGVQALKEKKVMLYFVWTRERNEKTYWLGVWITFFGGALAVALAVLAYLAR